MNTIPKLCQLENCESPSKTKGYCNLHYQRFLKYGDPEYTKLPRHKLDTTSPTYRTWVEMKRRCRSNDRAESIRYHDKGITVCDEWINDYPKFLEDMGERPEGHTIDRIDNLKRYSKENCRWATYKQQANNRKTNHLITIGLETKTIQQWCDEYSIPDTTFHNRLNRGWEGSKLLS